MITRVALYVLPSLAALQGVAAMILGYVIAGHPAVSFGPGEGTLADLTAAAIAGSALCSIAALIAWVADS